MKFEKYNKNPRNIKAADCVIRAISTALGKPWTQVYTDLTNLGFDLCRMPNEPTTYNKYLEKLGYKKQKMPKRKDNTRYTVEEFANELAVDGKTYIISIANHMTCLKNGTLIDLWNCGYKSVGNYWVID